MKPESLAVRSVNQYRRRDVLAYLGLRYYLENDCAKADIWARDISAHLVRTQESPIYHRSYHFKEIEAKETVIYRNIYLPSPNEIFAESALLYDCSKQRAFQSLDCVYSYQFSDPSSKEGSFKNYFPRFQQRNNSIAKACYDLGSTDTTVLYTDIKKFYPSIRYELALKSWNDTCKESNISYQSREFGERLLTQYSEISRTHNEGLGVLTGPMFSHLIANLILFKVDQQMSKYTKQKYWRYVDDFVLIGTPNQIKENRQTLMSILGDMGFLLHDERKDFEVNSASWLETVKNTDSSKNKIWTNLIANIKRFLIAKPNEMIALKYAFAEQGINIPLLDYSSAVLESSFLENFSNLIDRYSWFPNSVNVLTINKLVKDALKTRNIYHEEMNILLNKNSNIEGYERKQLISKLRFYAMRLSCLATPDTLMSISSSLAKYPELYLQARVMNAICSKDVTVLITLGSNAVQAAAQILRIQITEVTCSLRSFGEVELQGLAILRLNGISVKFSENFDAQTVIEDPLNQFALGTNPAALMRSSDLFIKEIACLRGIEEISKHQYFLDSAFDKDEQLSFDIIDQLQTSSYF
jgi:hypothetical protein